MMDKEREVECFSQQDDYDDDDDDDQEGAKGRREKTIGRKTQILGERKRESGGDCEWREMLVRKSGDEQTLVWCW